jgi:hypothetical protein
MMRDDWPRSQRRLNELLTAFEDADPGTRWLHVRSHDGSIISYGPQESAVEAVRRAQRRSSVLLGGAEQ